MNYKLTKSSYIKGLQCEKALYLNAYKKHLGEFSKETQNKFEKGRKFESLFKSYFLDGVDLDKEYKWEMNKNISYVKQVFNDNDKHTLFEAGFMHDEVLVLTDVLVKKKDGSIYIYEVKNSTELTDVIKSDLAVQYYVCNSQIENIKSFKVVLNDGIGGFNVIEMIGELNENTEFINKNINHFKEILEYEKEPIIQVGSQCSNPYDCEFKNYCLGNRKKIVHKELIDGIHLDENNAEFNYALDFILETNKPIIYLTGKAGTGKTTFLKYLKAKTQKEYVVLAPTGVAAINAGGQTINSFFQIPPSLFIPGDKRLRCSVANDDTTDKTTIYTTFNYGKEKRKIIKNLELLIIDEISMVRCDIIDVIDKLLRTFGKHKHLPFGGVQIVLIGDTFQLAPIVSDDIKNIFYSFYVNPFFFSSKVIKDNPLIYIELKIIYRQKDQNFIDLLNKIRINSLNDHDYKYLNTKYNPSFSSSKKKNYIILASKNVEVDNYNTQRMANLTTPSIIYKGIITGSFPDRLLPVEKKLELKVGAQVMLRKNKLPTYYNGTIATVTSLSEDSIRVEIKGEQVNICMERWENIIYSWNKEKKEIEEEVVGSFQQFPLKLAWAITVHKSQGLTFENVVADVAGAFSVGQVYVALSRCTSFDGLVLKSRIGRNSIKTDNRVLEFAKTETPELVITKELKAGKADYYYEQARNAVNKFQFGEAYEYCIKAMKYRNDIEKSVFKRYAYFIGELFTYKINKYVNLVSKLNNNLDTDNKEYKKILNQYKQTIIKNNNTIFDNEKKISDLSNQLSSKTLIEKELKDKIELNLSIHQCDIKTLNKVIKDLEGEVSYNKSKVNEVIDQNRRYKTTVKELKIELDRVNNIKWYQKLFGRK